MRESAMHGRMIDMAKKQKVLPQPLPEELFKEFVAAFEKWKKTSFMKGTRNSDKMVNGSWDQNAMQNVDIARATDAELKKFDSYHEAWKAAGSPHCLIDVEFNEDVLVAYDNGFGYIFAVDRKTGLLHFSYSDGAHGACIIIGDGTYVVLDKAYYSAKHSIYRSIK